MIDAPLGVLPTIWKYQSQVAVLFRPSASSSLPAPPSPTPTAVKTDWTGISALSAGWLSFQKEGSLGVSKPQPFQMLPEEV